MRKLRKSYPELFDQEEFDELQNKREELKQDKEFWQRQLDKVNTSANGNISYILSVIISHSTIKNH